MCPVCRDVQKLKALVKNESLMTILAGERPRTSLCGDVVDEVSGL